MPVLSLMFLIKMFLIKKKRVYMTVYKYFFVTEGRLFEGWNICYIYCFVMKLLESYSPLCFLSLPIVMLDICQKYEKGLEWNLYKKFCFIQFRWGGKSLVEKFSLCIILYVQTESILTCCSVLSSSALQNLAVWKTMHIGFF